MVTINRVKRRCEGCLFWARTDGEAHRCANPQGPNNDQQMSSENSCAGWQSRTASLRARAKRLAAKISEKQEEGKR
ncbi:MAG: hypothetical protein LBP75_04555 [Planctomycetota bacterium]|jgi:hypothetical protein|nr:hypothetical protein [Planctomycetota bacterium]